MGATRWASAVVAAIGLGLLWLLIAPAQAANTLALDWVPDTQIVRPDGSSGQTLSHIHRETGRTLLLTHRWDGPPAISIVDADGTFGLLIDVSDPNDLLPDGFAVRDIDSVPGGAFALLATVYDADTQLSQPVIATVDSDGVITSSVEVLSPIG